MDKKVQKKVKKQIKKHLTGVTLFFAVLFLVIGVVVGYVINGVLNSGKTNNTTIELNGSEVVSVNVGDTYQELGATFIIDGVDYKDDVIVEGSVKTDKVGTYVITYKLENELYNIVLKRIVTVGGVSNGN